MLQKNIDISDLSNFKTPAKAKYFFEIKKEEDLEELKEVFTFIHTQKSPFKIIGGGTNILFAFDEFDGVIIKNSLSGYSWENNVFEVYGNENISDLAGEIEEKYENTIWHRFIGLPGSVGGAIYGNAGCFGLEIQHNFKKAWCLNLETGKLEEFDRKDMDFSYRSSFLKKTQKYFLVKARFDVSYKEEKYHSDVDNIEFREKKQPKGRSCGSFFKNPSKENSAGSLIEKAGLKGYKIGGAYFSDLHANFLMSDGTAKWQDLIALKNLAIQKVQEKYDILLEPEVQILQNK